MLEIILKLIFCHFIGDYVLQSDFIASTKGKNWYHLIVHCVLYIVPFYFIFGYNYALWFLLGTHIFVDALKARYEVIDYKTDQIIHFITLILYYINC